MLVRLVSRLVETSGQRKPLELSTTTSTLKLRLLSISTLSSSRSRLPSQPRTLLTRATRVLLSALQLTLQRMQSQPVSDLISTLRAASGQSRPRQSMTSSSSQPVLDSDSRIALQLSMQVSSQRQISLSRTSDSDLATVSQQTTSWRTAVGQQSVTTSTPLITRLTTSSASSAHTQSSSSDQYKIEDLFQVAFGRPVFLSNRKLLQLGQPS